MFTTGEKSRTSHLLWLSFLKASYIWQRTQYWSINDYMLASGANDNKVIVWDTRKPGEICRFSDHKAAVKALAWSHYSHNTLASGGGTTDKTIKIWNTSSGKLINSIDTGSQVCHNVLLRKYFGGFQCGF